MFKVILLCFVFLSVTYAEKLNSYACYNRAKLEAQKQNKHLMVLITQDNCQYCKRMKNTTFKDPEVIKRINESYVFVEVNRYTDKIYPKDYLTVYGVPTTYFLYKNGNKIMRGAGGYWNKEDFFSFMDDAEFKVKKKLKNKQ
jgi:thioredoxin-related protein